MGTAVCSYEACLQGQGNQNNCDTAFVEINVNTASPTSRPTLSPSLSPSLNPTLSPGEYYFALLRFAHCCLSCVGG